MAKKPTEKAEAKSAEPTKAVKAKKTTAKKTTTKKSTKKEVAPEVIETESVPVAQETAAVVEETAPVAEATVDVAVVEEVKEPKVDVKAAQAEFLDSFNWHNYQEGIDLIEDKQLDEFEKLVKENFVDTSDEDVIEGEVVYMTEREAIIDINAKSEGVISLNEFRYNPDLKVGDKVEVIVDIREDRTGQLVLSHRKARVIKAWDRVNNAHDNAEIVKWFRKM